MEPGIITVCSVFILIGIVIGFLIGKKLTNIKSCLGTLYVESNSESSQMFLVSDVDPNILASNNIVAFRVKSLDVEKN